jgi:hypothetical protein
MKSPREVKDYAEYVRAMTPVVKASRLAIRLLRTRRPIKTRTKDAEELRMLVRAYHLRKQHYAQRGLLVQTGPHTWEMRLPES